MKAKVLDSLKAMEKIILFISVPFKVVVLKHYKKVPPYYLKPHKDKKAHKPKRLKSFV